MPTPDELRAEIASALEQLRASIEGAAGDGWERQPATGEGEESWSPRRVAEHALAVEVGYTSAICVACGYPGLERISPSYESAAEALAGLESVRELCHSKTRYVTPEDLLHPHQRLGNVEGILRERAAHLRDHAQQIRAARAATA